MKKMNEVTAPVEKETRSYVKHAYAEGLTTAEKRKQRRVFRKSAKAVPV